MNAGLVIPMGDTVHSTDPPAVSVPAGSRHMTFETGGIARQADGAVVGRWGDSMVLATVVSSRIHSEDAGFLPLTVDYREKYAGAGRIPGGYFKREAKPTEHETLTSRIIDRTIRPLFPGEYRHETTVTCTLLSVDPESDIQILALNAVSLALYLSDIPWNGPVASIRVTLNGDEPTSSFQYGDTSLDFVVSCTRSGLVMVEGEARETPESVVLHALESAAVETAKILDIIEDTFPASGRSRRTISNRGHDGSPDAESLRSYLTPRVAAIYDEMPNTRTMRSRLNDLREEAADLFPGQGTTGRIDSIMGALSRDANRRMILAGRRIDGRNRSAIRPVSGRVGYLPGAHGSSVFTRGQTQAIVTCTLGSSRDELDVDAPSRPHRKRFYVHYNFPPYAVGETGMSRGPGRREIGHGNLAARALSAVLPGTDVFPYTIRIDSEITESNGSSSMATVCGTTLALMDAGVPVTSPVAGVAMGLIAHDDGYVILSDITGGEDHCGDMDLKIAGTRRGITAVQLDNKVGGIPLDELSHAFEQGRDGRMHILDIMSGILDRPRSEPANNTPRIVSLTIMRNRVGELIGQGGRTIQNVQARTGSRIEVAENGSVKVHAPTRESLDHALQMIHELTGHARLGERYTGTVVKETEYGIYIRLFGSIDGFLPIASSAGNDLSTGDGIAVEVSGVDERGRIELTRCEPFSGGGHAEGLRQ